MYALSLFTITSVAIVAIRSASASPPMLIHKKHHVPMHYESSASMAPPAANSTRRTRFKHVIAPRSIDLLDLLISDRDGILAASNNFSRTAKNVRSQPARDDAYQHEAIAGLTTYRHSLDPLQSLLAQLATDKGLSDYDKSNRYETLLKDIVNACKYTFKDVDDIIDADPLLGPILGPIMYEIKCLLDQILDAAENITDATLNWLAPLLKPLIASATKTVCRSNLPSIAGICLPL